MLGFRCGSIPEVLDEGVTGKVIDNEEEATTALHEILSYDRGAVRRRFEERFTSTRMAKDYLGTYRKLLRKITTTREPRSTLGLSSERNNGITRIEINAGTGDA